MKLHKILLASLALVSSFIQAGEVSDRVFRDKKIIIGTEGTYPPFTFRDEWGNLAGFDIDVSREIARILGLEVQFKEIEWKKIFNELDTFDIDTIANSVAITPERRKKYDFSSSIVYTSNAVAINSEVEEAKKSKLLSIKNLDDLKDIRISMSKSNALYPRVTEAGAKVIPNNASGGLVHAMKALRSGKVDAIINDDLAISEYMKKHSNSGVQIVYYDTEKAYSGFPFQRGEDELVQKFNDAIAKLRADGTLKKLSEQWFGKDNTDIN